MAPATTRSLGTDGNDFLIGGDGNDLVDGNRGNDLAALGAGDDTFQWDPGDGSDRVEGQDGFDTMLFNGANVSENFDLSANGNRARFFRNVGNVTMDTHEVESIDLAALGGADNLTVGDLTGTGVTNVSTDLSVARRRRRRSPTPSPSTRPTPTTRWSSAEGRRTSRSSAWRRSVTVTGASASQRLA